MGGIGHDFKMGVNFIYEPKLYITFNAGTREYAYTHLDNNAAGRSARFPLGSGAAANLPMKQFALYFQDDWKLPTTSRSTPASATTW